MNIPRSALILGLSGLLPFIWGAATLLSPDLFSWGIANLGPRFVGPIVLIQYGTIILAFMSGVLWGFATKAVGERATLGYVLSVIPALWAFFMVGDGAFTSAVYLIAGFIGLLLLDWSFWRQGLAPEWWMRLRIILTAVVVFCLGVLIV
ncbi:MAG: DUF3429 domain-containing protein [Boseongicola sp.]|nr:DUF3429 domain-containing protein [Boseongicola sp.]MDD9979611.1 DUF3429 domain-containing protein [Boseongicola sp.]